MVLLRLIHPLTSDSSDLLRDMFVLVAILLGAVSAAVHLHYFRQAIYLTAVLFSLVAFHLVQSTFSLASPEVLFLVATGTTIPALYGLYFYERILIMCTTSVSGAVMIVVGADIIANTGIVYNFRHGQEPGVWEALEWGIVGVLAIVGFFVQYYWTASDIEVFGAAQRERKPDLEKPKDTVDAKVSPIVTPVEVAVAVPEKVVTRDTNAWA
jgi:hypothetical protein